MPFITQCPHPECGKFLLMEEESRGTTVECMVCKQPIELEPVLMDVDQDGEPQAHQLDESRFAVRTCPKCKRPIRVPPDKLRKAMQCPECDYWGIIM